MSDLSFSITLMAVAMFISVSDCVPVAPAGEGIVNAAIGAGIGKTGMTDLIQGIAQLLPVEHRQYLPNYEPGPPQNPDPQEAVYPHGQDPYNAHAQGHHDPHNANPHGGSHVMAYPLGPDPHHANSQGHPDPNSAHHQGPDHNTAHHLHGPYPQNTQPEGPDPHAANHQGPDHGNQGQGPQQPAGGLFSQLSSLSNQFTGDVMRLFNIGY